jgi:hypothetical protein
MQIKRFDLMASVKGEAHGVVYFIGHGKAGPIKIGFTADRDPMPRLRQLQTGSPECLQVLGTVEAYASIERKIHTLLAPHMIRGEWFERDAAISVLNRLRNNACFHQSVFVDRLLFSISIKSIPQDEDDEEEALHVQVAKSLIRDMAKQLRRVNTDQPLPFRCWLMTQTNQDHATGDLARDMIQDADFPSVGSLSDYLSHVKSMSDSPAVVRATIEAWIECDAAIRGLATREEDRSVWPTS